MSNARPESAHGRFTEIYETNYHRILGYARRRASPEDAADVVAETFAVAWRRIEKVPDGEEALYWLYATARRVLANERRADNRRRILAEAVAHEPPPAVAEPGESPAHAAAALARLRDDERELLLLLAWEGLDARGVAAVLAISRNAARIRIHRARRRFAAALVAERAPKRNGSIRHSATDHVAVQMEERT